MSQYRRRVADDELEARLGCAPAVLLEGPRACGKTETARRAATTTFHLATDSRARELLRAAPRALLCAKPPVLLDEWPTAPEVWELVGHEVHGPGGSPGRFILTASDRLPEDTAAESGWYSRLRVRPMSLFESGDSSGHVSLRALFDGGFTADADPGLSGLQLVDRIVTGGWPALLGAPARDAQRSLGEYVHVIAEVDLPTGGARRDPQTLRRLLASLGAAAGTDVGIQAIAGAANGTHGGAHEGVHGGAHRGAHRQTVKGYLELLGRLMLTEDLPAWTPPMRTTTPVRTSCTRFMTDPSLAVAALGLGAEQLLEDPKAAAPHFEGLVVRDLRVYAQPLGGRLRHWRDHNDHEVDVVITLADGRWAALMVRMDPDDLDTAASSLRRLVNKVDTAALGEPAFLAVVTTRCPALRRRDGVLVLPVGSLGP